MRDARILTQVPRLVLLLGLVFTAGCGEAEERHVVDRGARDASPVPEAAAPADGSDRSRSITWTGCDISKKAYMLEAAAEYMKLKGIEIVVTGGGATRGIRATAGGSSDIGGTCRHCLPEAAPAEKGAIMTLVAWDALVFCTHLTNPVDSISEAQARAILIGKTTN